VQRYRQELAAEARATVRFETPPGKQMQIDFGERLVEIGGSVVELVTEAQARIARAAYRDFGKGSGHPARLNFGDCFAYALAKVKREPLLFKGSDFAQTDIKSASK
jgi:ribonuclease VapC